MDHLTINTPDGAIKLRERHFCIKCLRKTFHGVLDGTKAYNDNDEEYRTCTLTCLGCGSTTTKEFKIGVNGEEWDIKFSPAYESWHLIPRYDLFKDIPNNIKNLYEIIIKGYNNDESLISCANNISLILIAIGSELEIIEKITTTLPSSLQSKVDVIHILDYLGNEGAICKEHKILFSQLKFIKKDNIFNALYEPPRGQILLAIRIIEHIIGSQFLIQKIFDDVNREFVPKDRK